MNCCQSGSIAAVAAASILVAGAYLAVQAQDAPPTPPTPAARAHAHAQGDLFPGLLEGIKSTPGCLGLDTARTSSGKNVIFAWFEDKASVKKWYYSDMHMGAMEQFFGKTSGHSPLANVPDDIGPLMVVASITMAENPQFEDTNLPISQIAIEIYKPVTGGLFLGSRFSPDALKVPNIQDYTPRN